MQRTIPLLLSNNVYFKLHNGSVAHHAMISVSQYAITCMIFSTKIISLFSYYSGGGIKLFLCRKLLLC